MNQFAPRKLSPRLEGFDYVGAYAYFITTNTDGWQPVLRDRVAEQCIEALHRASRERDFELLAYTFMPDHVHILASGTMPSSDMQAFLKLFKQLTAYDHKQTTGDTLWQSGFFEHVLRPEEDIDQIAAYIWHNPVRKALVTYAADYPFSGPRETVEAYQSGPPVVDSVPKWLSGASYDRPKGPSLREGAVR